MHEQHFASEEPLRGNDELSRQNWPKEWRDRWRIRSGVKDLRDSLARAGEFPNRQKIVQAVDQLLELVLPVSQDAEWNDNWRRKLASEDLDPFSAAADEHYNDPRIRR